MKNKRHFIYAGVFLIIIILCVIGILWNNSRTDQRYAEIYQDGKLIERIEWATLDGQVTVAVGDGNVVCADREGVWMQHADCPDQLCVRQGKIKSGKLSIICLPNRVTVTLTADAEEVDGVAG